MGDLLKTDVLVIGEGCAGQTAALAASEQGCEVLLLGDGLAPSTAISTGFLTFAAHDDFSRDELFNAMYHVTGKGLCDNALLTRLVDEAPREMAAAIARYEIPVDKVDRGLRARRAVNKSGRELLSQLGVDHTRDNAADMTGLMMEFSSTHGTALYAQLRKAIKASSKIKRLRGSAIVLDPDLTSVGALVDDEPITISARAIILATGGLQGLFEFTDTPNTLTGSGHGMAVAAGAAMVDMEFIQFYPLAVREKDAPAIFLYPDFPKLSTLVNSNGENVLVKHLGEGSQYLADLHNWDHLSAVVQKEIVDGRKVYVDFRGTKPSDWAPDSLTGTFLSRCVPGFLEKPVQVAPSSHYTIGGLKIDVNGLSTLPNVYAVGEVAGGVHGANRHGGTALVEAITFGRIAGRHAAANLNGKPVKKASALSGLSRRAGKESEATARMGDLRRLNQFSLGPIREKTSLLKAGDQLARLKAEVSSFGWNSLAEMQEVVRLERAIVLSDGIRQAMLRREESRGVHTRSDFPNSDDAWLKKQVASLRDDEFHFEEHAI